MICREVDKAKWEIIGVESVSHWYECIYGTSFTEKENQIAIMKTISRLQEHSIISFQKVFIFYMVFNAR